MKREIYCFFGVDGAGKTTTIREIKKRLEKKGKKCKIMIMGRAGNHKIPVLTWIVTIRAWYFRKKLGIKDKKSPPMVDIYRKRGFFFS